MKTLITLVAAGSVLAAGVAADADPRAELKKLEGTWEIVSIEAGGKKLDAGKGAPDRLVVKDGVATFSAGGMEIPTFKDLKLQLDPTKKPMAADLVRGGKESLPCIYEVTDAGLKLAMPMVPRDRKPGETLPRPESFDSKD